MTKDEEIIRRGYKPNPTIFIPESSSLELLSELNQSRVALEHCGVHQMTLSDAFYDTKCFLDTHFKLHKIPILSFLRLGNRQFKSIKESSPYDLEYVPIETDDIFCAAVEEILASDKTNRILFEYISLCGTTTEQTSISLVHEFTHTQIDSVACAVGEFYHAEAVSILLELIHALSLGTDEKMVRLNDARRLYEMLILGKDLQEHNQGTIQKEREELLLDSQYFISDTKAYRVFLDYYYGNAQIKKEILKDIQKIFDAQITVEEFLNKYEATTDIQSDAKRLRKYFNR